MDALWYTGQIGIALEGVGAVYLVAIARASKKEADALDIKGDNISYNALGPLLSALHRQLRSHYGQQKIAFGMLFLGLVLQFVGGFRS
jgi:hypothetical protein